MTPLATLRTAQLFQTSWARISSIVGILKASIWGFSGSFAIEEPLLDSVSGFEEAMLIKDEKMDKSDKDMKGEIFKY